MTPRIGLGGFAVLVVLLAVGIAHADERQAAAVAASERGNAKLNKGDLDGALAEFTRAIEIDPSYAGAYADRGIVKWKKGDARGTLADYTRAIEIYPACATAYSKRGVPLIVAASATLSFGGDGRIDGITGSLFGLTQRDDERLSVKQRALLGDEGTEWETRRTISVWRDDGTTVILLFRRTRSEMWLFRTSESAVLLKGGFVSKTVKPRLLSPDELARAQADFDAEVRFWVEQFDGAMALVERGREKEKKGDLDGALGDYTRAIEIDPRNDAAYGLRGTAKLRSRDLPGAARDLQKKLEIAPTSYYALFLLFLAQALGPDGEAKALTTMKASMAARGKPIESGSWVEKMSDFLQGKITAQDFEQAADASPEKDRMGNRCEAYFYTGMVAWIRGDKAAAVKLLERCVATKLDLYTEFTLAQAVLKWPR